MIYVFNMNPAPNFTFGYARVSTDDQNLAMQIKALMDYGIPEDQIYTEKASGSKFGRARLGELRKIMREGDKMVVWKLDRLGRTVAGIVEFVGGLERDGIDLVMLTENVDTSTPMGKAVLHFMAAMAELERDLISERTKAGMAVAKAQGAVFGKAHYITGYPKRLAKFEDMFRDPGFPDLKVREIIDALNDVDKKAPKIESLETYRKWRRLGWPNAILKDPPLDEPE